MDFRTWLRAALGTLLASQFYGLVVGIKNPIISGWNPDPAILRVDDEYFIATSTFEYFPGTPIYKSTDLAHWELYSHVQTRPSQIQLYGVPTTGGVWAPSLSRINGMFYVAGMSRWTYDPLIHVWPRASWVSSPDLKTWSDPVWSDLWGIDPQLFQDPDTKDVYLNMMSPNNDIDRLWGIYQCKVDIEQGNCIGEYRSLWNGTLPHTPDARPEGPKMFKRGEWYYLLIAEGGTDENHRATIARSKSPEGPWAPAPNNPLIYNGAYGTGNLTVQSTGHATIVDTPDGEYYASFLARRNINGSSPLGRESFLCPVTWDDEGWPTFNDGKPIMLSETFGTSSDHGDEGVPPPFHDTFDKPVLDPSWYQLRTQYAPTYKLPRQHEQRGGHKSGIRFKPNVFTLSQRDTPAAILRKQKSLNMTLSAHLLPLDRPLGPRQTVGISAYLSELQHQDIGLKGCVNSTGLCIYTEFMKNGTIENTEYPLNTSKVDDLALHIRAEPLNYHFGYSISDNGNIDEDEDTTAFSSESSVTWLGSVSSSWLAFAPPGWSVFTGASFALFASGNDIPWPVDGPEVGFAEMKEVYFEENIPDYDRWQ